ncbi:MAG TPA: hypothetical protein PK771_15845, partial [Spirochaetota bacterium]|nr:hypothetical protein [Spirochaetota bacterium]
GILLFVLFKTIPNIKFNFINSDKKITQKEYFKKLNKEYVDFDKNNKKKSYYYKFYMTLKDNLHLTNKIAILNGYHRILFDFEKNYVKGKDPDWIYPGNKLIMPDNNIVVIKDTDNMWRICEKYLIDEVNIDEIKIRDLIEKSKKREVKIVDVKREFQNIINQSNSEMIRGFLEILKLQDNFDEWEPYLEKTK